MMVSAGVRAMVKVWAPISIPSDVAVMFWLTLTIHDSFVYM